MHPLQISRCMKQLTPGAIQHIGETVAVRDRTAYITRDCESVHVGSPDHWRLAGVLLTPMAFAMFWQTGLVRGRL